MSKSQPKQLIRVRDIIKASEYEAIYASLRNAELKLRIARTLGDRNVIIAHVTVRAYVFLHRNSPADRRIQWMINLRDSTGSNPMWVNRSIAATAAHIQLTRTRI